MKIGFGVQKFFENFENRKNRKIDFLGPKIDFFAQNGPKVKNFENPKIGQNRLFSVKKVDFWPPKVDFRPKMAKSIFRRCRPRQKEFLRFWPFFRGQCAKTVGRIGASLGSF